MATEIVGKVSLDGSSIGNVRKQLKEATAELIRMQDQFGMTSTEAINAAKKVAQLKDQIQDAREQADLFDPGKKFQAFVVAGSQIAAGFSAVQGAMALIGVESGQVEKALLKVQAAMALSQGLSELADLGKSWNALTTIIQSNTIVQKANAAATALTTRVMTAMGVSVNASAVSFRVLKAAIVSTGIGALVVALGLAVEALMNWADSTDDAKAAQDRLNASLERQQALYAKQKNDLQFAREIAKRRAQLAGDTADEINKIDEDFNNKQLKLSKDNRDKIYKELVDFEKQNLKRTKDGKVKGTKEQIDFYKQQQENLKKANAEVTDIEQKNQLAILDNQIAAQNTSQNASKQAFEKAKAERQKQLEDEKKFHEQRLEDRRKQEQDLLNLRDEYRRKEEDAAAKTEAQKIQLEKKRAVDEVIRAGGNAADVNAVRRQFDQQAVNERNDFAMKSMQSLATAGAASIQRVQSEETAKNDIRRKALEDQQKIDEARIQSEQALLQGIGSAIGALGGLFEQGTAASKAGALAEIAINTGLGFANGLRIAQQSAAAAGPGAAFAFPIFYASQVAAVLKAISQARNILKTVKGGGAGGNAPTGAAGIATAAPVQASVPINTQLQLQNQQAINQMGNQASRAYILNSDLQNNQQINAYLQRNSRLG